MKKIPKTVWVLLGLMAAIYTAWSIAYPSGTWRYRMTVTVETPEGIKTGSAVREIFAHCEPHLFQTNPCNTALAKGEAAAVDLGKRGVLFALMRGGPYGADYGWAIVHHVFFRSSGHTSKELIRQYRWLKTGKVALHPNQYPMFVRFKDPKDPKTVENLLDMEPCTDSATGIPGNSLCLVKDHFEEAFGAGVKLKEVTIEMTDDQVTWGVEKWLPWLPERKNVSGSLGGTPDKPFEDPTKTYLNGSEFHTGKVW